MTTDTVMIDEAEIDEAELEAFVGHFAEDLGAVCHAAAVLVGDRLGLYGAMGDCRAVTVAELAERTGCDERYLAEWLAAQAASGYVEYDPDGERFRLNPEQALVLTSEENPFFAPGGFEVAASMIKDVDMMVEALRTGRGVHWGEHHADLFSGTNRFFKPNYIGNLVDAWLPSLDGIVPRLEEGARVADVGCGYGASTILMAQAYPASTFVGFDAHEPSVVAANDAAATAGVSERCRFEVATAKDYDGDSYALVTCFDCLHDTGDPVGAATHVRQSLADGGAWMIVEPNAGDGLAENLNPVGRIFYSASTLLCVPMSRSQEIDRALDAQAGEPRIREVVQEGGFTRFCRAAETPFNHVYEARP